MTHGGWIGGLVVAGLAVSAAGAPAATSPDAVPTVRSNATVGMEIGSAGQRNENVTIRLEVDSGTVTYVVTSQRGLAPLEGCAAIENNPTTGHAQARCQRVDGRVTASMGIGTDTFAAAAPFTDPILYSNIGGNDNATGGAAADVLLGANTAGETFDGRAGDDRFDGRDGADTLLGGDGRDTLDGGAGNDILRDTDRFDAGTTGFGDTMRGGDGNDEIRAGQGEDSLDGGNGDDLLIDGGGFVEEDSFVGGAGRDTLALPTSPGFDLVLAAPFSGDGVRIDNRQARGGGIEVYVGSASADTFRPNAFFTDAVDVRGEGGDDVITGTAGRNTLTGGGGADRIDAAGGDDIVDAKGGETTAVSDTVDCGAGTADLAVLDLTDRGPSNCDGNVDRSAIGERPHVVLGVKRALRVRGARVAVPVSCPKRVRHACAGTLQVAATEALLGVAPRTRYRVAAGRSKSVLVRARDGLPARGRRVQLRSTEKGDVKGVKRTLRRARIGRRLAAR
jgi:hypothetical protein